MAGNIVRLVFKGDTSDLDRALKNVNDSGDKFKKNVGGWKASLLGFAGAGGVGAAAAAIGGATSSLGALGLMFGTAKAAMSGTKEALDEYNKALDSGDWEDYNKLLGKMVPEQQAFTKQLIDMKAPLSEIQKTAARGLLPGVTDALKSATGLFPILNTAVDRTSKIMSNTARELGHLFETERFKTNLDGFLKATEPVTTAIGNSMVKLTDKFIDFGAKMKPAGEGVGNFITGITDGVTGMLDKLSPHADSFKRIWTALGDIFRTLGPIIGEAAGAFADTLAPALEKAAVWLRDNQGLVTWVITNLPLMIAAFQGFKIVTTLINGVSAAWKLMSLAMMINPWVLLIAAVLLIAYVIYSNWDAIKGYLLAAWNWIKNTAISVWNNIKSFFSTTWASIKAIFNGAVEGIKTVLNWFSGLKDKFHAWIGQAKDAVVSRFNGMVAWVRGLPGMILGALGNLGSLLWNSGQSLITGLWNGISSAIGWVKSKISGALSSIRNLFPFSPAKEGPFSGMGYTTYSGKALATDFASGITNALPAVRSAATGLLGAVQMPASGDVTWNPATAGSFAPQNSGGSIEFGGNVDSAFASAFMKLVRTGAIQVRTA